MDHVDPSLPRGDPGPRTAAHRLATPPRAGSEGNGHLRDAIRALHLHPRIRAHAAAVDDDEGNKEEADEAEELSENEDDLRAFGLDNNEIAEYELTAWDAIDIEIEQEARSTSASTSDGTSS